eukprot:2244448-Pyramimonas_sp.AAC.2
MWHLLDIEFRTVTVASMAGRRHQRASGRRVPGRRRVGRVRIYSPQGDRADPPGAAQGREGRPPAQLARHRGRAERATLRSGAGGEPNGR